MSHLCWILAVLVLTWLAIGNHALAQEEDKQDIPTPDELRQQGEKLAQDLREKISELLVDSPHELFTRHLESLDALVRTEWARCEIDIELNPGEVARSITFMQTILDGLIGDAGKWDSYAAGQRPLVMAYVSRVDRTMHAYHLRLPRDWDPDKSYPAILYLHGHVPNAHPMWYVSLAFNPEKPTPNEAEDKIDPYISISPWGRGNGGYRDSAETDVWESLADAKRMVKCDEDRQYLTGHSMGGFGTWNIATRTPDVWAGIVIYAGGMRDADPDIAGNVAQLPVLLWHGARDRTIPLSSMERMRDALKRFGNDPKVDINAEAGHMVPAADRPPHKQWLLTHTRKRPDSFQFIADQPRHTQAWGIRLPRPGHAPYPRFTCRINGSEVHIDSQHADGLDVRLGEGGLGLSGDVTVFWNGEKAFQDKVGDEPIRLGNGAGRRRW